MTGKSNRVRVGGERHKTFLSGYIAFGPCPKKRNLCFVRDIARDGAHIELAENVLPPPRFILELRGDPVAYNARIVWRDGRHLGVSFREASDPDLARMDARAELSPA